MTVFNWISRPRGASPWRDLERMRNHMENMYGSLANSVGNIKREALGVFPLVNIYEDNEKIYVTAELPGLTAEEVNLSVKGNSLTIRGERVLEAAAKDLNYHRKEREGGTFRRVINLPLKVEAEVAEAVFKNGILKVVLPKVLEAQSQNIVIKTE